VKILPPIREDDKMLAGLTYPFWFLVVPFVMFSSRREEPFVQFHARQSLWLGAASLLGTVLGAFLCWAFMAVMPSGAASGLMGLAAIAGLWVVFLFLFFLFFFMGDRASTGEFMKLPFVGEGALQRTLDDLGLTSADLDVSAPPARAAAAVPPLMVAPSAEAVSPPSALSELRPPTSVRTGPPLRPLPSTPRAAAETRKTWEPSASKPDPTNVLKGWLRDEEAKG
jgi:uncharacterized membrane protein